ncbi:MAG: tyrosine transporter [Simkania sp.]|nr:tyrosine transporter [Simkania sp.]
MTAKAQKGSGSLIGAMLLIAGSCVGAGMLALPIITGLAGFFPSIVMFLIAWAFMLTSAFLMVEINGWFKAQVNIVSMAGHSLGQLGRSISWVLYLFLFYALSVAYISGSGNLTSTMLGGILPFTLPDWAGSLFFVGLFGSIVLFGTRQVDLWNRVLMVGKIVAFLGLVFLGMEHVKPALLEYTDAEYAVFSLPVLIIAFGFHNMIPSITNYLQGDLKRVKQAIVGGSVFALVIYLIWEIIVLGVVPLEGPSGIKESLSMDREAAQAMAGVLGVSWISTFAQILAFFAILTSFLAQSLGLVHFLADGLKKQISGSKESLGLCALALLPPLVLALIYPQLFFKALNFAGGFCANILFGFLPAMIVWMGRKQTQPTSYRVFGGKPLLISVMVIAVVILLMQLGTMMGHSYLLSFSN